MNLGVDRIKKYGIESIVIFFSIIVSFYIEDQRDLAQKKSDKNKLITDLINTIDEDLEQLNYINSVVMGAVKNFNEILSDIDSKNQLMTKSEILNKMMANNIGISFFKLQSSKGIWYKMLNIGRGISFRGIWKSWKLYLESYLAKRDYTLSFSPFRQMNKT